MYEYTVPLFNRGLANLEKILDKGMRDAKRRGIEEEVFLRARLAPDMFHLIQQIQYAYFSAIEVVEKVSGAKAPALAYDETTHRDLKKSLASVRKYLATVKPKQFDGKENVVISTYFTPEKGMKAAEYIKKVSLPNFYFHSTIAYGILRENGVPLLKEDFWGTLMLQPLKKK